MVKVYGTRLQKLQVICCTISSLSAFFPCENEIIILLRVIKQITQDGQKMAI